MRMRSSADAKKPTGRQQQQHLHSNSQMEVVADEYADDMQLHDDSTLPMCLHTRAMQSDADDAEDADNSNTPTPTDAGLDEGDTNSSSSFSLEDCLNEFRARRLRRESTHSRDVGDGDCVDMAKQAVASGEYLDEEEEDLINQNRCNKEQERKCKPCKNGFCYCFTSDSGDGCSATGVATTRAAHVRTAARRHRKSETNQMPPVPAPRHTPTKQKEKQQRRSAPEAVKVPTPGRGGTEGGGGGSATVSSGRGELTAISRLETSSHNAPLIHIIQELHNNCVISEVRVNKDKIQQNNNNNNTARTYTSTVEKTQSTRSPLKKLQHAAELQLDGKRADAQPQPTAPPLDKISEIESQLEQAEDEFIVSSPLESSGGRSEESMRRRKKYGGRLLQKRLSRSQIEYVPRDWSQPPPKPPRSSMHADQKSIVSSLASTSPSVREAERILDEFLLRKGLQVGEGCGKSRKPQASRRSYPSIRPSHKTHPLPSCPSLSDLQKPEEPSRSNDKNYTNNKNQAKNKNKNHSNNKSKNQAPSNKSPSKYEKNIRNAQEKAVKELSFGWKEPKIADMLNYDANSNPKEFKSQACQAEPQAIGWHMASGREKPEQKPAASATQVGWKIPAKVDLDTVDGGLGNNLAANIGDKNTPVKTRFFCSKNASQKFIWGEQLRNLSPWPAKKAAATKSKKKHRGFLNNSRKRILRLVSPKKHNVEAAAAKPQVSSVGVQTTEEQWRPCELQSPPGSYHSAVPTSSRTSPSNGAGHKQAAFDFTRVVRSPPQPKKQHSRLSQRKLSFPMGGCASGMCADTSGIDECGAAVGDGLSQLADEGPCTSKAATKTYRSFHSDLDQDVTLSKMGYILSNIRAKLEASDQHAERTFQEIGRRERNAASFDCTDGPQIRAQTRVDVHARVRRHLDEDPHTDTIYSEIEEDSIHISSSPQFENTTSAPVKQQTPEAIYATVNKKAKSTETAHPTHQRSPPTALGKILHESLKKSNVMLPPLPPKPPRVSNTADSVSYSTPAPSLGPSESLNNIRVLEHHSPPKRKNLSKSDLSLQRSEIFLENLCCSEIVVDPKPAEDELTVNTPDYLQKIENRTSYISFTDTAGEPEPSTADDSVSYEMPDDTDSNTAGSQFAISQLQGVDAANHSTPKKQPVTFTTKHAQNRREGDPTGEIVSCPSTPNRVPPREAVPAAALHAHSMSEINSEHKCGRPEEASNDLNASSPTRYKKLKNALRKSIRKSKKFVKSETKRLSATLNLTQSSPNGNATREASGGPAEGNNSASSFNLERLFALDDDTPIDLQIARAVSICRQLPDLEISPEMVEAERLLLFSSLRRRRQRRQVADARANSAPPGGGGQSQRFFIDSMRLPIRADVTQDLFFNYFYICTFECNGVISSTQSVECLDHVAIFRDCGIEFVGDAGASGWDLTRPEIQCQIFMLRLRKVSTLSLEPSRAVVKLPTGGSASSLSSAGGEIVSRFKLHATYTLRPQHFAPFEYVDHETLNSGRICLRASKELRAPLERRYKSSNLSNEIEIMGRADVRLPLQSHSGFLNVQDPYNLHNWNRRWCSLEGLKLSVWHDVNDRQLLSLDLRDNSQSDRPLEAAPRELCARPRSFCLQSAICKADERVDTAAVFFAADTTDDLALWLQKVNETLAFINMWMK